jgi:uncharacterized protein (TIGR00730 family)
MGALAEAALAAGGEVVGVIPKSLMEREIGHGSLTELRVVGTMHERKALMNDLSGGFITLPGGYGTLEELLEVVSWAQLGIHRKPCGLLDVDGFWTPLLGLLDNAVTEGFIHPEYRSLILTQKDPATLLEEMARYRPPPTEAWISRDEV